MVQTATQIFGLALAMSRASAPRIQNRQEGPWISTSSPLRSVANVSQKSPTAAASSATIENLPNPDSAGECEDVALGRFHQVGLGYPQLWLNACLCLNAELPAALTSDRRWDLSEGGQRLLVWPDDDRLGALLLLLVDPADLLGSRVSPNECNALLLSRWQCKEGQ
jgi:hypothetical protein